MLISGGGSATFEAVSSTVAYTGNNPSGNTTLASTTYYNLSAAGSDGYFLDAATIANAAVSLTSGATFDLNGHDLTAGSLFINGATLQGSADVLVTGSVQVLGTAIVGLTSPSVFEQRASTSTTFTVSTPAGYTNASFYDLKFNTSNAATTTISMVTSVPNSGFSISNNLAIGDNSSSTVIFTPQAGSQIATINQIGGSPAAVTVGTLGSFNAGSHVVQVAGDLTIPGTFTPATSTVYFNANSSTSTISGSTSTPLTFYNFKTDLANKPLVFATSTPYFEVGGLLTLRGTSGNEVTLNSTASGTQWLINHQGTEDVEFISLKDSGCIATSTDITITSFNVVDRGNNDDTPCWLITPTVSVSGTVYSDEGVTTATSTVTLALGGSTSYTTSTNGSGVYTFPAIPRPATSSVMTVWLNNGTSTKAGATVTRYLGNGNLADLHIYKDRLITRHEDAGPLTATNISVCDKTAGAACTDSDLHFEVTGVDPVLTVDNDWALYLWGGDTFTPGGTVILSAGGTAANPGGDLKWASSTSILDIAGNALSVGGDWLNGIDGTFTKWSTSTATFIATQSGMSIVPGTQSFASTTFNGSGGTWSASGTTMNVVGNMLMTAGTINNSAGNENIVIFNGDVTGTSGIFNLTTSTVRLDQAGAGSRSFGATSASWTFNNLTMRNLSTTSSPAMFTFVSPGTVTTTISEVFTIGNSNPAVMVSLLKASSSHIALAGTTGTPLAFAGQGQADFEFSTIAYTGNNAGGNTSVPTSLPYWDVVFNNAAETYAAGASITASNDLLIPAGTLDITGFGGNILRHLFIGSSGTLTPGNALVSIGQDFTNNGTFNSASGTIGFTLSVATSTITGTSTFWNFLGSGTDKPLVFGANQTFTIGGLLTLTGSVGDPLTLDSTASGTQWLINHQGTETITYASVKDSGCVATSTYITVSIADSIDRGNNGFCWLFPSLSFTISPLSVNLSLNESNTFTNSGTNTLTVSTNGEFGYNVTAYADSLMTRIGTATTIANWTGTNAAPTVWTTSCIASATCGFGYNTDDADLTQFTSTKFAGFTTSTPGEVVATDSAQVTGDATVMTYRSSVDLSQAAGDYQTTIRYIVTPAF
jgi:hypothetical protein